MERWIPNIYPGDRPDFEKMGMNLDIKEENTNTNKAISNGARQNLNGVEYNDKSKITTGSSNTHRKLQKFVSFDDEITKESSNDSSLEKSDSDVTNTVNDSKKNNYTADETSATGKHVDGDFDFGNTDVPIKNRNKLQSDKKDNDKDPSRVDNTTVEMDYIRRSSRKSVTSEDLPTYLIQGPPRAGKGPKIGSENLITDNVSNKIEF